MLKKAALFIFVLLTSGTGLTLYLPEYIPPGENPKPFVILEDSLKQALQENLYLYSSYAFDESSEDKSQPAIQIGIYATLADARVAAYELARKDITLSQLPTIFKATDIKRQWYVMALGPLQDKTESQHLLLLLQEQLIPASPIVWPIAPKKFDSLK